MQIKLALIFLLFFSSCYSKLENEQFKLQIGDFLFQDLDSSPLCEAIEIVTPGYKNGNFSHVGIVIDISDSTYILEAIPDKVKKTNLHQFLNRSFDNKNQPKVIVGRLKKEYQFTIDDAIIFLKSKIGHNYDDQFLLNNDSYYCSELIYEAFEKNNIFELKPMTFLNPLNNDTLEIWKEYYQNLNIDIPEKELGINPGIMSISNKIDILKIYGKPDGM